MTKFMHAAISPPARGTVEVIAGLNRIRIPSADTNGALAVMEMIVPCDEGQPRHIHALEDEFLHVLKGKFGFWCADEYVELDQGGCIAPPRNVPHQIRNVGNSTGRLLVVVTPAALKISIPPWRKPLHRKLLTYRRSPLNSASPSSRPCNRQSTETLSQASNSSKGKYDDREH
ncbi:cupin domain-containing protein [Rhizobium sp. CNPSo 3490]|uniref:cupin domain-containing protein n=1 Tax=Rhizobium sp. CNPSo 3490 TaxID=3021407 RepID=UPI00254AAFC3|nr:cupin domain-containing protein [Rhizobium sp. CNPSo 3490]MDK4732217.1 cupin domain-containing protein [Rhizobium sp. CNPSo 3490]